MRNLESVELAAEAGLVFPDQWTATPERQIMAQAMVRLYLGERPSPPSEK